MDEFYKWLEDTYGITDILSIGSDALTKYWIEWSQGKVFPETTPEDTTPPTSPGKVTPPTYEEIVASLATSPQQKYNAIKLYYPSRLMEWLNTEEGFAYLSGFADQDINTGVYTLPDGTQVTVDPNTGGLIPVTPEDIPVQTFTDSDGNIYGYELPDGTYVMSDGVSPTTLDAIQGWIDNYETNKTSPPTPDPTTYPIEPNTEGFEWTWDGNQWVETKVEPDITIPEGYTIDEETGFLKDAEGNLYFQNPDTGQITPVSPEMKDMPPFPTEAPPPGYVWQYDSNTNTWVPGYTGEQEPYEMPPYPIETPPTGYIWDYNPNTGQWELTPGQLPGQEAMDPYQEAQIELQNRALELQQWGMQADQAWRQAQLEQQQRETEAQMLTQPASWLEYHALTGKQAAVQPWQQPLQLGDYPSMQAGAPLYGWGPEWEQYYGGQAGAPGGIPPTGGAGQPPISPTGGQPPIGGVQPRVAPTPSLGVRETGGIDYSRENERLMNAKYKEIKQAMLDYLGYGTPAWEQYISSFLSKDTFYSTRYSQADSSLRNWVTAQAEIMTRQWYAQTYGEEYPYYPGQAPETVNIPFGIPPPQIPGLEELLLPGVTPTPPTPSPTPPSVPSFPLPEPPPAGYPSAFRQPFKPPAGGFPSTTRRGAPTTPSTAFRQPLTARQPISTEGGFQPFQKSTVPGAGIAFPTEGASFQPISPKPIGGGGWNLPPVPTYSTDSQVPGYYDPSKLPQLLEPSRQFQARMGPTAEQQMYGYEQARTGALPMETKWRLFQKAPPSGRFPGLRHRR